MLELTQTMQVLRRWVAELHKIPMAKKVKVPDIDDLEARLGDDEEGLFAETDEMFQCTMSEENKKGLWYIDAEDLSDDF